MRRSAGAILVSVMLIAMACSDGSDSKKKGGPGGTGDKTPPTVAIVVPTIQGTLPQAVSRWLSRAQLGTTRAL